MLSPDGSGFRRGPTQPPFSGVSIPLPNAIGVGAACLQAALAERLSLSLYVLEEKVCELGNQSASYLFN